MRTSAQQTYVHAATERLRETTVRLWDSLSDERRERLARRKGRLLWKLGIVGSLVQPWMLVPVAVVAYMLQGSPRRIGRALLLLAAVALPTLWIREALADAGLLDAQDGVTVLSFLAGVIVASAACWVERRRGGATQLRPLAWWMDRGLDPKAYGIPPRRVLLGSSGRAWISAPEQVGVLVIGPPRSGKTSGVIVPNVLSWIGPCVVTSTRRDVLDACSAVRASRGTVWCFDPIGSVASSMPASVRRLDWSPVGGAASMDVALARARALLAGAVEGTEGRDHWRARGTQLLGALLHAAATAQLPMSAVMDWVHGTRLDAATHILDDHGDRRAAAVIRGLAQTPDRERGSIWSAVAGGLAAFDDSTVLASADRAADCGFSATTFLACRDTVFIVAPSDETVPLAPLVVGLVEEIRAEALRQSTIAGALNLPLLLALDEVATICPLPSLPQVAAEGGGRNVILLAVLQDLSQAAARWGRDVADGLMTLAGVKLILPGLADADTLHRVETLAGKHWVEHTSTSETRNGWLFGDWTSGTHRMLVEESRIPAGKIRQLRRGTALCIRGEAAAEVIRLVRPADLPFGRWRDHSAA
jgi:type IV secretory pathway TraG/TraD family ATPase VirD4